MVEPSKPAHTLADHVHGAGMEHTHDGDEVADHDHDHFDGPHDAIEDNPIWMQDHLSLTSVGIDIGSAGTQIVFSRLDLARRGEDLSSRYVVVSRETLYQSPVALTPYQSEERIDDRALGMIIDAAYAAAGLHPDHIDTGVVILTGEALRRENAKAIADLLADQGGEFVCATAGHHMEAMLAAYGSGAAKVAYDGSLRILNIDIGGGTTKLALIDRGKIVATAALHIGGRLMVVDEARHIVRLDPGGRHLAAQAGFDWKLGDAAPAGDVERVAQWMAEALVRAIRERSAPSPQAIEQRAIEQLYLTDPIPDLGRIDGVMFSGGVAEYIYERETRDFGDWGLALGAALRRSFAEGRFPWPVLPAGECIRATALGASEYSVQLSGNTTFITSPGELLPRRNLQVLQPEYELPEHIDSLQMAHAIREHFTRFDLVEGEVDVGLAFRWQGAPAYERVAAFANGLVDGLAHSIAQQRPLYIILDGDIAQTIGRLLKEEFGVASEILVIDGVTLRDFDYIDLGRIRMPSNTVPVTIKSLVFNEDPRELRMSAPAHGSHYRPHHPHPHAHHDGVVGHAHDHDHIHDRSHDCGHDCGNPVHHRYEHGK